MVSVIGWQLSRDGAGQGDYLNHNVKLYQVNVAPCLIVRREFRRPFSKDIKGQIKKLYLYGNYHGPLALLQNLFWISLAIYLGEASPMANAPGDAADRFMAAGVGHVAT